MKKTLLTLFTLLIFSFSYAQVGLGIRAGYGVSKLMKRPFLSVESNSHKSSWVPTPTAGIVMDVTVSDIFFIQIEALYSGLGAEYNLTKDYSDENQPEGANVVMREYYHLAQFPMVAKFATYERKVTTFFEFGFNASYIASGEYKVNNEGTGVEKSGDVSFVNMKRGDFGFIVGIGFGTDIGKRSSWALNLRYNRGVSDLNIYRQEGNPDYVSNTTRAWTLSLILMIL